MILIDYYEFDKTFLLWNTDKDERLQTRDFKSLSAARNHCIKNKLSFKLGISCDG